MKKSRVLGLFVALVMVATISAPAFARNWVQIGDRHYIDTDSIRPTSNYGAYTFKTKYMAKDYPLEEVNGRKVWTVITNSYIDCKSAYGKTISYTALDANDRTIVSNSRIYKQWLNIGRGTNASESYDFVCTDRYLRHYPEYNGLWLY